VAFLAARHDTADHPRASLRVKMRSSVYAREEAAKPVFKSRIGARNAEVPTAFMTIGSISGE